MKDSSPQSQNSDPQATQSWGRGVIPIQRLERLQPTRGLRPGRPTDPTWTKHPKVRLSEGAREHLDALAKGLATGNQKRKLTYTQAAAILLEQALAFVTNAKGSYIASRIGQGAIQLVGNNKLGSKSSKIPMSEVTQSALRDLSDEWKGKVNRYVPYSHVASSLIQIMIEVHLKPEASPQASELSRRLHTSAKALNESTYFSKIEKRVYSSRSRQVAISAALNEFNKVEWINFLRDSLAGEKQLRQLAGLSGLESNLNSFTHRLMSSINNDAREIAIDSLSKILEDISQEQVVCKNANELVHALKCDADFLPYIDRLPSPHRPPLFVFRKHDSEIHDEALSKLENKLESTVQGLQWHLDRLLDAVTRESHSANAEIWEYLVYDLEALVKKLEVAKPYSAQISQDETLGDNFKSFPSLGDCSLSDHNHSKQA